MPLEKYYKVYGKVLKEVREETYRKFPGEAGMLMEFIDNWIDLIPIDERLMPGVMNSLSGILLFHLWKLSNWITYKILSGKYFEGSGFIVTSSSNFNYFGCSPSSPLLIRPMPPFGSEPPLGDKGLHQQSPSPSSSSSFTIGYRQQDL
ncbi:MAG: hypothetical protein J7J99_02720 [Thermoprotei archaeon]|nr:hypothetical protein [Thermoprotei archaeon]